MIATPTKGNSNVVQKVSGDDYSPQRKRGLKMRFSKSCLMLLVATCVALTLVSSTTTSSAQVADQLVLNPTCSTRLSQIGCAQDLNSGVELIWRKYTDNINIKTAYFIQNVATKQIDSQIVVWGRTTSYNLFLALKPGHYEGWFDIPPADGRPIAPSTYFDFIISSACPPPPPPIVAIAAMPDGKGYWLANANGTVFHFGDAVAYGSADLGLTSKVVGIAATPDGKGYWLVTDTGKVYPFGDAGFFGSISGPAIQTIVGISTTPNGKGYLLVSYTGAVYRFGDAKIYTSNYQTLTSKVVGIAAAPDGKGYWFVTATGTVYHFGDAGFFGSISSSFKLTPKSAIVGITTTPDGKGYWLVSSNGNIHYFGDASSIGTNSLLSGTIYQPVIGLAATPDGNGYWITDAYANTYNFGDAGAYSSS
ncbi:MAG TPA: hypothetical protein VMQ52_04145 [Candidatus Saccharimonadales bacterium]|nr:hypothetical protein [Candidatus Saccharimonadales bacterium]